MLNDLDIDFYQLFWADDGVLGFTNRESYLKGHIEGVIGRWSLKFGQCASSSDSDPEWRIRNESTHVVGDTGCPFCLISQHIARFRFN